MKLTPADKAAWRDYLRKSRAAAEQYEAMPSSLHRAVAAVVCACGRTTINLGGVCHVCRKGAS